MLGRASRNDRKTQQLTSMRLATVAVATLLISLISSEMNAQAQQRVSAQVSAFSTLVTADGERAIGAGVEPQLRINASRIGSGYLSVGVGGQLTKHYLNNGTLTLKGVLVEPRISFQSDILAIAKYISFRGGLLKQESAAASSTNGYALGVGGGLVKPIRSRLFLDAGVGAVYQDFDDARTPSGRLYSFSGTMSFVARLGINVGL